MQDESGADWTRWQCGTLRGSGKRGGAVGWNFLLVKTHYNLLSLAPIRHKGVQCCCHCCDQAFLVVEAAIRHVMDRIFGYDKADSRLSWAVFSATYIADWYSEVPAETNVTSCCTC